MRGGVATSVIFYITRKIFERNFKIVAFFLDLFIIVLISILSVILIIGLENTSTSYRVMSHPYMILILIITYLTVVIFFWIIPPEVDTEKPRKELTETRKFIMYFFFVCLLFSLLLLLFWIPAGFRYVHEGAVGGPHEPVDIYAASLWFIYNGVLENPAPFIAPAAVGIRFKLMKIE